MASHDPTALLHKLKAGLPDFVIAHFGEHTGFVERDARLDPIIFIWTLILGWSAGATRSLAGLARAYQRYIGSSYTRSAFYRRFEHANACLNQLVQNYPEARLMGLCDGAVEMRRRVLEIAGEHELEAEVVDAWPGAP